MKQIDILPLLTTNDHRHFSAEVPGVKRNDNFYMQGLELKNDYTWDIQGMGGILLKINAGETGHAVIEAEILKCQPPCREIAFSYKTVLSLKKGEHEYFVRLADFDLPENQTYFWRFVRKFEISSAENIAIETMRVQQARWLGVKCWRRSRAVESGETAQYEVILRNESDEDMWVCVKEYRKGWQTLHADFPADVYLKPHAEEQIKIKVKMQENVMSGSWESKEIVFRPFGREDAEQHITLTAVRALEHPHCLVDRDEVSAIREKVVRSEWARGELTEWRENADAWKPKPAKHGENYLFSLADARHARCCGLLYQITEERKFAEKVIGFLRQLSDPMNGYLSRLQAANQEMIHEAEFFKDCAIAYDCVAACKEMSDEDHYNIERVYHKYYDFLKGEERRGEVVNWIVAGNAACIYWACTVGDLEIVQECLYGTCGVCDQLSKGVFSDGFWYESTVGYHLLAAGYFSEIAQAVGHYGINFKDISVPASHTPKVNEAELLKDGLVFDAWGPNDRKNRTIPMLWDSLLPFFDYRGVVFGMNDSCEGRADGIADNSYDSRYDIAYYLYRKPEYLKLIRTTPGIKRDLIFGLDEEADEEKEMYRISYHADNCGFAVLRSQTEKRLPKEQIQVALKYGSHGGPHGHYDRCSISSIMRYGKSLFNPVNVWYSYHTFMYKFYVQSSIAHNMVTVDLKQQDPRESKCIFYGSTPEIQAMVVENRSPWSYPPYGGWPINGEKSFENQCWKEGRTVIMPDTSPGYGIRTGFTEEILSRRAILVTDDYVVTMDYLEGEEEHDYDCIYHLRGLQSVTGNQLQLTKKTPELSAEPLNGAQFITNCDWYTCEESARLQFFADYDEDKSGKAAWLTRDRTGYNEVGKVNVDLYYRVMAGAELIIGYDPEFQRVNKQVQYLIRADGCVIGGGKFGSWILGKERVCCNLRHVGKLELIVRVHDVAEDGYLQKSLPTLFWGDAGIICEDGREIPLSQIAYMTDNIKKGTQGNRDYAGEPVVMSGVPYLEAVATEPDVKEKEAVITINLEGMNAVQFHGVLGGDYPVGSKEQHRRFCTCRQHGKNAVFVSVIEPYEMERKIQSIEMPEPYKVSVCLTDGRKQFIEIAGMEQREPQICVRCDGECV